MDIPPIKYDYSNTKILEAELNSIAVPSITGTYKDLLNTSLSPVSRYANLLKEDFKHYVLVGIGGSDLGSRTIYDALHHLSDNKIKVSFIGANTDPLELDTFFKELNIYETVFCVVSKSGETVEVLANFLYIRQKLKEILKEKYNKNIVVITNPERTGTLRSIATKESILVLDGPKDVGDRYSVLSIIGLLTSEIMGLKTNKLIEGAKNVNLRDAFHFAAVSYISYVNYHRNISILMPYASELKQLGFWFRQLWAESLGKSGKGITPIAALGATDQHSQIQLYNQGPDDKLITFIEVKNFERKLVLSTEGLEDISNIAFLNQKNFEDIIHIERYATSQSLSDNNKPHGTIYIEELNEYSLGALFYFLEVACEMLGKMMDIDPFDQPGVEKGKDYIYNLLGKVGA